MCTDGLFNCDPHAGNLLVRMPTSPHPPSPPSSLLDSQVNSCSGGQCAEGPLPILLDFGLCKQLSEQHKLAFCQLVVALSEMDVSKQVSKEVSKQGSK